MKEESDFLDGAIAIAEYLGINPRRAWHLCLTGSIPASKVGGKWMTRKSSLNKFFDKLEEERADGVVSGT